MIEISPSLLPLPQEVMLDYAQKAINLGIPRIHLDIIDGKFVNQHGLPDQVVQMVLEQLSNQVSVDIHLMVKDPLYYIQKEHYRFASNIYIHKQENQAYQQKLNQSIRAIGCEPGIVINPDEDINDILDFDTFRAILVMGVVPGLSGQKMLPNTYTKIKKIQSVLKQHPENKYHITLDGGVTNDDLLQLNNQIDCCVMGAAIFNQKNWEAHLKQLLIAVK